MSDLHGLLNAIVTPFTPGDDEVDETNLRSIVDYSITSGVHGIVAGGSTGEFAAMTDGERRRVVEIIIEQAAGRVPVIAQTGGMTTREAIGLSQHAEAAGAEALMVVGPYYEPLTANEMMYHFRSVAASVGIDVMVYNLPVATGVNLLPEDLVALAAEAPNVKYVKDTSGDFTQGAKLIHQYSDVLKVFVGLDTFYFSALVEGGAGSVNGAANIICPELVEIYDHVQAGDILAARAIWDRVYPLMQFLVSGGYVTGVKGALEILGRSAGSPRAPIEALVGERDAELRRVLAALEPATTA
jgi:4-hydroxy-tetrahydrodipicolinate synthase